MGTEILSQVANSTASHVLSASVPKICAFNYLQAREKFRSNILHPILLSPNLILTF